MKEKRLKTLNDCLRAIQDAYDVLEEVRDEEQEAYDNMPEGLQYSERGDMMQDAIDCLDEAVDAVKAGEMVISVLQDSHGQGAGGEVGLVILDGRNHVRKRNPTDLEWSPQAGGGSLDDVDVDAADHARVRVEVGVRRQLRRDRQHQRPVRPLRRVMRSGVRIARAVVASSRQRHA